MIRAMLWTRCCKVHAAVRDVLIAQLDLNGFKNREERDLTGFVDGTANPKALQRVAAAQIPLGEPGAWWFLCAHAEMEPSICTAFNKAERA